MVCELPYGEVWIRARSRNTGRLPAYLGSTIRGVVAYRLKETVCIVSHGACRRCHLRFRCLYPLMFEPPPYRAVPLLATEGNPPPLIFIPPQPVSWSKMSMILIRTGETLEFGLRIFGRTTEHLDRLLEQLNLALRGGLGSGRLRFEPEAVLIRYRDGIIRWDPRDTVGEGPWMKLVRPRDGGEGVIDRLTIRFLTPFRMKQKGRYRFDGALKEVVTVLVRRFCRLCMLYGRYEEVDYQRLIRVAGHCQVVKRHIRWVDWVRASRRQGVTMKLGGYIGDVEYAQVPWELYEWLKIGEVIHIGKNVIFGLGRISVEVIGGQRATGRESTFPSGF